MGWADCTALWTGYITLDVAKQNLLIIQFKSTKCVFEEWRTELDHSLIHPKQKDHHSIG